MKRCLLSIVTLLLVVAVSNAQDTIRKSEVIFDGTFDVAHAAKGRPFALQQGTDLKRPLLLIIRLLDLETNNRPPQTLPVSGFVVMSLRSGRLETIIDGTATRRAPEDFWTANEGSAVQLRVLGQNAILETITVSSK